MTEPTNSARLMIALIDEVQRLRGRIISGLAGIREASGLGQIETTVLSATVNASQPPTVPQIGRSLGHSRQVIQRAADRLVAEGLAEWIPNPLHKKARRLVATVDGRQLHAFADLGALRWAEQIVGDIDAAKLNRAVQTLTEVRVRLQNAKP